MQRLFEFDMEAFRAIHLGWHSALLDLVFLTLSYLGLGQVQFVLSLLLLRWEKTKPMVVPLLTTIVFSGLIFAQILKSQVIRDRPSRLMFALPQEQIYHSSFPSGHTTTSFAVATMITLLTWGTPRVKWGALAYCVAFFIGVSRIYRGVHWPTDTMAGACLGTFTSCLICLVFRARGWWPEPGAEGSKS